MSSLLNLRMRKAMSAGIHDLNTMIGNNNGMTVLRRAYYYIPLLRMRSLYEEF